MDPISMAIGLLIGMACFGVCLGGTWILICKSGLRDKVKEEVRAQKLANDLKESTS